MSDIAVAFLWHQHQPYYPDDVSGQNAMPWVRLHGTKDYWGMAMHLAEVPEMRAAINLVPSLLVQIQGYTDHSASDEHLRVSRLPADSLSEAEKVYLLDNFFMANPDQMIRPFARYHELYQQRGQGIDTAERAARRFGTQDLLDLQCWSNLTWIHPIAFEHDTALAEFRRKGRHYSEADKQWLLDKQMALLAEVIPLHKKLAASGQVELTTTPFYHPILPLLVDKTLAREAMPHVELPRLLERYLEDAQAHVERAVAFHTELFGIAPRGMWPAEGSVAQAIIPIVAKAGIQWIASDEEVLSGSTGGRVARDSQGFVQHPELLYRPWLVEEQGAKLQMVFRDHALSDQIGFQYQRVEPNAAVDNFIGSLEGIGRAVEARDGNSTTLVSVILDGENCWEYYPNGGVDFLRALYRQLASHSRVRPVCVGAHLQQQPAKHRLERLFAGSWIGHSYAVWIGQGPTNRAWDLLSQARVALVRQEATGQVPAETMLKAWDELFIAEGSDWFWWLYDRHSSSQDQLFDSLFRKHLQNVYTLIGLDLPAELLQPLSGASQQASPITQPTALLEVKVNGRETFFEWINAGVVTASTAQGAMSKAEAPRVSRLLFGFDLKQLLLRLDVEGNAHQTLGDIAALRIHFHEPAEHTLEIADFRDPSPRKKWLTDGPSPRVAGIEVACDAILEIAIPWKYLGLATGATIQFSVELIADDLPVERLPAEGFVSTTVPSSDYELMMWQA